MAKTVSSLRTPASVSQCKHVHAECRFQVGQIGLHLPSPEVQSGQLLGGIDVGIEQGRDQGDRPTRKPGCVTRY